LSPKTATAPPRAPRYTQGHPSDEALRAYRKEELVEDEQERAREHLAVCEECSQKLLDLTIFFSSEPRKGRLDPDDLVEAWHQLVKTLEHDGR
jgi:hypothetical protein